MKETEERLIRYCCIDTESDGTNSDVTPSTQKQFNLANMLAAELKEMGLSDVIVDEHCYVYGFLKSNVEESVKKIGFVAHMDTSPQYSGADVTPKIVRNYGGGAIPLNDTMTLSPEEFPDLKNQIGKTIMTASGNSLLGADDKAGIVSIMEAMKYLCEHPEIPHGDIAVGFTPDEEIGNGPKYFDIRKFGCDFGYTMDGGAVNELCYETFNAASAEVTFHGFAIHPGSAKDRMINAAAAACEFQVMTPKHMRPEHTEGREGFIHLTHAMGDCDHAELIYILRDHDADKLERQKAMMRGIAEFINNEYGSGVCELKIIDGYRNMAEVFKATPEAIVVADQALRSFGMVPDTSPVRGGTDGATLSRRGMPCPNLGCGGRNFHGPYEYIVMEELDQSIQLILKIVELVARG